MNIAAFQGQSDLPPTEVEASRGDPTSACEMSDNIKIQHSLFGFLTCLLNPETTFRMTLLAGFKWHKYEVILPVNVLTNST